MLAASLTEKALGSRVDVTSDNPVTKLGPSSVSSNSASDYRITIDSARKALKKGSVAFDGGVEIDKLRSNLKTSSKIQPYRTGTNDDSDDEDIVPKPRYTVDCKTVNDAILIPKGTTAQRPGETGAYTIDSLTVSKLEIYLNGTDYIVKATTNVRHGIIIGEIVSILGITTVFSENITKKNVTAIHTAPNAAAGIFFLTVNNGTTVPTGYNDGGTYTVNNPKTYTSLTGTVVTPPEEGLIRFNTETKIFEGYANNAWGALGGVMDLDQDTYVQTESVAGADEDTLSFYTAGVKRVSINNTGKLALFDAGGTEKFSVDNTGGIVSSGNRIDSVNGTGEIENSSIFNNGFTSHQTQINSTMTPGQGVQALDSWIANHLLYDTQLQLKVNPDARLLAHQMKYASSISSNAVYGSIEFSNITQASMNILPNRTNKYYFPIVTGWKMELLDNTGNALTQHLPTSLTILQLANNSTVPSIQLPSGSNVNVRLYISTASTPGNGWGWDSTNSIFNVQVTNASIINHKVRIFYEDSQNTTYKNTASTTGTNKSYLLTVDNITSIATVAQNLGMRVGFFKEGMTYTDVVPKNKTITNSIATGMKLRIVTSLKSVSPHLTITITDPGKDYVHGDTLLVFEPNPAYIIADTTLVVTVSGNPARFFVDGVERKALTFTRGNKFIFDVSDPSNNNYLFLLNDGTDGGGTDYTTSVSRSGTAGTTNATVSFDVDSNVSGSNSNQNIVVTVAYDGYSNKFYMDGILNGSLSLVRGTTYIFNVSNSNNTGHVLKFSTTKNGTHAGGVEYTSGITRSGNPGETSSTVTFVVPSNAPSLLYYYCSNHSGMAGNSSISISDSQASNTLYYYGKLSGTLQSGMGSSISIATTNNFLTGTLRGVSVNGNVTTVSIYDTAAGDATPLIGINNVIGSGKYQYLQIGTEYLLVTSNVTTVTEGATTKYNITLGGTFTNTVNVGISTWSIYNTREMTVSNQIPVKSVSLVISGPPTNGSLTSANTNSITADWDLPTDTGSGSNTDVRIKEYRIVPKIFDNIVRGYDFKVYSINNINITSNLATITLTENHNSSSISITWSSATFSNGLITFGSTTNDADHSQFLVGEDMLITGSHTNLNNTKFKIKSTNINGTTFSVTIIAPTGIDGSSNLGTTGTLRIPDYVYVYGNSALVGLYSLNADRATNQLTVLKTAANATVTGGFLTFVNSKTAVTVNNNYVQGTTHCDSILAYTPLPGGRYIFEVSALSEWNDSFNNYSTSLTIPWNFSLNSPIGNSLFTGTTNDYISTKTNTTFVDSGNDAKYTSGSSSDKYRPVSNSYTTLYGPLYKKSKLTQLSITYSDVQGNLQANPGILALGYFRITKIDVYNSGVNVLATLNVDGTHGVTTTDTITTIRCREASLNFTNQAVASVTANTITINLGGSPTLSKGSGANSGSPNVYSGGILKKGSNPFCNLKIESFQSTNVLIETSNFNIGNDTSWDDIDTNTTDAITVPTMNNLTVTTGGLADKYTGDYTGFYTKFTPVITLKNTANFAAVNNLGYYLKSTQTILSNTFDKSTETIFIESFDDTPTGSNVCIIPAAVSPEVSICGIPIVNPTTTYKIQWSVTNLANNWYRGDKQVFNFDVTDDLSVGTISVVPALKVINLDSIATGGLFVGVGNLSESTTAKSFSTAPLNANTQYRKEIAISTFFQNTSYGEKIKMTVTYFNINGTSTSNGSVKVDNSTNTGRMRFDYPSYTLITSVIHSTTSSKGQLIHSGTIAGDAGSVNSWWRVQTGGTFPGITSGDTNFGKPFVHSESLLASVNMQLVNGSFVTPNNSTGFLNYSDVMNVNLNYTTIASDAKYRWVSFKYTNLFTTASGANPFLRLQFDGTNFNTTQSLFSGTNFSNDSFVYVKLVVRNSSNGIVSQTYWLNANTIKGSGNVDLTMWENNGAANNGIYVETPGATYDYGNSTQGGINVGDFNSRSTEKDRYISLGVPSLTNDGTDYVVHLYVSVAIRSNSNKTLKSVTASITQ